MKRCLLLMLILLLSGCSVVPSIAPAAAQTATPIIVIHTVLVTVFPTEQKVLIPTSTPLASSTPQVIVITATANQAFTSSTAAATAPIGEATAPLPPNAGGGLFTNLARSADKFSLRCQPDTLNFGVSTSDPAVTGVDFYYRIEDRLKISISSWQFGGSMASDGQGNFSIAFPASRVDPDLRSSLAWFDYQFVGISKVGDVIGRSGRISKQVTYTLDCSE